MRCTFLVMSCTLFFIKAIGTNSCLVAGACLNIRDPFSIPDTKKKPLSKQPVILEGIVYAGQKRSAAVLVCGDERQVVERGERFQGYRLIKIGKNFVEIARGKQKQKLFIQ